MRKAPGLVAHGIDDLTQPEIELAVGRTCERTHCHWTHNRWIIGLSDNCATSLAGLTMAGSRTMAKIRSNIRPPVPGIRGQPCRHAGLGRRIAQHGAAQRAGRKRCGAQQAP